MHYFVLLLGPPEAAEEPDAATQAAIMAEYQKFYTKAGAAIRAGDALLPSVTGVRITGDGDHPVVTEGPFAEGAEVAGGYFVIEAEDLDEALSLAADIPACRSGAVEVWPMVGWSPTHPRRGPRLAGAPARATGEGMPARHRGMEQRRVRARAVRRGGRRSHPRRGGSSPTTVHSDDRTCPRRTGDPDRWAVRRRGRKSPTGSICCAPRTATKPSSSLP